MLKRALFVLLSAMSLGTACRSPAPESVEVSPTAPIVLISIDTLRSDRLPVYGYEGVETPAIDALAADSIVFDRAYSHYPLTLPSHVSLLTGVLPDAHGIRDNLGYPFDSSRFPYLPTILKRNGFATGAAVSAYVLRSDTGISTDFDFFDGDIFFREWVPGGALSRRGPETLQATTPWLEAVATEPFFLFFHIYEPHTPLEAPEPFASRFPLPYDAEVAAADAVIGDLLAELKRLDAYDRSMVVLLSDHGEGLGDHGEAEHGVLLYREAIQVPLIVKLPQGHRGGSRVATPAQLVDVVPTVLRVLGMEVPEGVAGMSLLELDESRDERPIYSETFYARIHYGWSDLASIVSGPYHYIHGPVPRLFNVVEDPGQRRNILKEQRPTYAALRDEVMTYQRELVAPEEVDEETKLKLAALGYLDTNFGDTADGPLPDPETRLATLEDLWAAFDLRKEGKPEEALAAADRALKENPEMADAWQIRGSSLEDLGEYKLALEAYREALNRSGARPRSDVVLAAARVQLELGQIEEALKGIDFARDEGVINPIALRQVGLQLAEVGLIEESLELLGEMAADGSAESLNALARVKSEAGAQREAQTILEGVLRRDESDARAHENLSLVYLRMQNWELARRHAERAIALDQELSQAWNNLGAALHMVGAQRQALDAWEKAIELDAREYDAMFNLGLRAAALGEVERSRAALEQFVASAPPSRYGEDLRAAEEVLRRLPG